MGNQALTSDNNTLSAEATPSNGWLFSWLVLSLQ